MSYEYGHADTDYEVLEVARYWNERAEQIKKDSSRLKAASSHPIIGWKEKKSYTADGVMLLSYKPMFV